VLRRAAVLIRYQVPFTNWLAKLLGAPTPGRYCMNGTALKFRHGENK
jgi:hypothetical protein